MLTLGLIPVEQRASLPRAEAGERRAPCTSRPGRPATYCITTSLSPNANPRPVRKGWRDLAAARGSDTEPRQGAGRHGPAPCLRYDLTPESGSLWASTRPRPCSKPLADVLTTVMVGLATGLATVALVHLLEHLDLVGVEGDRCHAFVMERLDAEIEALFERGDEVVEAMG